MKAMKKLIPTICMLLVSAVLLGTSTYAWFSMNTQVTATGMSVQAKSDQAFLMIENGHVEAAAIQTAKKISVTATNTTAKLLPAAHNSVTNIESADTAGNWYYKTSKDPAASGGAGNESDVVALTDLGNYVLVNEFSLTVAKGSNAMSDIKVNTVTLTTTGNAAVKVLVASSTAVQEFAETDTNASDNTVLAATLTDSTVVYIKVYIYWDGNDSDVYSNNIANLLDTSVVITFTGTTVVPTDAE